VLGRGEAVAAFGGSSHPGVLGRDRRTAWLGGATVVGRDRPRANARPTARIRVLKPYERTWTERFAELDAVLEGLKKEE
jgi:hypothetical protein